MSELRRALEHLDVPGEHEARVRTWTTLEAAFAGREPAPRRTFHWRPLAAVAVAAALVAGILSPPGDALLDSVRDAIGVEGAEVALFALPAGGRVLAVSPEGAWVVSEDGAKRFLGRYAEASWSPFGRYVVASRGSELAALEPDGEVRWTLARPRVSRATWGGTRTDTRIAYLSGNELRIVAGDGTGDRRITSTPDLRESPLAWRPGRPHQLAFATQGILLVVDERGEELWSVTTAAPLALAWSRDGARLAVVSRDRVTVFSAGGRRLSSRVLRGAADAAFAPDGRLAVLAGGAVVVDGRTVFRAPGRLAGIAWSPDGRWLLVAWPEADQWLFVRGSEVQAAANVVEQFGGPAVPAGWADG